MQMALCKSRNVPKEVGSLQGDSMSIIDCEGQMCTLSLKQKM